MSRFIYPIFKAFDDDGEVLAGGKMYTYEAGTSTPKAAYQDAACTVPHTNPIILSSLGEKEIFFLGGTLYKINLTDAYDNQISGFPVDNYDPSDTNNAASMSDLLDYPTGAGVVDVKGAFGIGTPGGGRFYWNSTETKTNHDGGTIVDPDTTVEPGADGWETTTSSSGTGCWIREDTTKLSLFDFCAKGNGTFDDTPGILGAIKCGGEIIIPIGTFIVDETVDMLSGVYFKGESRDLSIIKAGSSLKYVSSTQTMFEFDAVSDCVFENFTLSGNRTAFNAEEGEASTTLGYGARAYNVLDGSSDIKFIDMKFTDGSGDLGGIVYEEDAFSNILYERCIVESQRGHGIRWAGATNVRIHNCTIDDCGYVEAGGTKRRSGIDIAEGCKDVIVDSNTIENCIGALAMKMQSSEPAAYTVGEQHNVKNIVFSNNILKDNAARGIGVQSAISSAASDTIGNVNIQVIGNILVNNGDTANLSIDGVFTGIVKGNLIRDASVLGVNIGASAPSDGLVFADNIIRNCYEGLRFSEVNQTGSVLVRGNIVEDNDLKDYGFDENHTAYSSGVQFYDEPNLVHVALEGPSNKYGIGVNACYFSGDLDDLTQIGNYACDSTCSNLPLADEGYLTVNNAGAAIGGTGTPYANACQTFIARDNNKMYFRRVVGGVWQAWQTIK